jgi:hypothetical protein
MISFKEFAAPQFNSAAIGRSDEGEIKSTAGTF